MTRPTRVLVVDDSPFVRSVLRELLVRSGFEVVDVARDGLEALEKIARLRPDVVTLDLMMPHLDGLSVLEQLGRSEEAPAVVVVSVSGGGTAAGLDALAQGAVSVIEKPTALTSRRLYEIEQALIRAVREAAEARPHLARPTPAPPPLPARALASECDVDLAVLGASAGGPQALSRLVPALPSTLPVPLAIALHIPAGYTQPLAKRLDDASAISVVEASEGLELVPGVVAIARGGLHLRIERGAAGPIARLSLEPLQEHHYPSVDVLFESAAAAYGARVLGVVLTGMGDDGLEGARAIRARGGRILTEARSSCVVYGMPRVVREAGLANAEAPLSRMAGALVDALGRAPLDRGLTR